MRIEERHTSPSALGRDRPARMAATVVGAAFTVVGLLGFVPGVTTSYDDLHWAGHHSGAELFGVFQVSVLHNLLHLLLGLAGLAAARRATWSVAYLFLGGVAYAGLWVYGLAVGPDDRANVVPLDTADDWLHLGLALAMLALGLLATWRQRGGIGSQTPM